MLAIDGQTIDAVFCAAHTRWPEADFLVAPAGAGAMRTLTYSAVETEVARIAAALSQAGYGYGHRAAVLIGATLEHYIIKLALNRLGMSCVPVNPDYHPAELAYLLEDSDAILAITGTPYVDLMRQGIEIAQTTPEFVVFDDIIAALPKSPRVANDGIITADSEASLLYTSGTTGRPKGCVLSHEYELMVGESYITVGAPIALKVGADRVLNPLPAFHVNAGIFTFFGVLISGNCLIQSQRFSARTWWRDIQDTRATVFHYLGVVISVLLTNQNSGPADLGHLRAGFGAGVEPALHVEFERRFGIPLIECWGMTEMCRVLSVFEEPRQINTRAMGRARPGLEAKVVDGNDKEVTRGQPGEMVLRHSKETPRKGFFSGYLNKHEETVTAWKNDWFHTGDTCTMDENGVLFFVDRAKNIIRRAGENIAAAEVENVLFQNNHVANVACIAAPDDMREEEVMACVVVTPDTPKTETTARAIFDHAFDNMAYFKPPGWVLFVDELPVTGTQKVVKHKIFAKGVDPTKSAGIFDFRALKKRG